MNNLTVQWAAGFFEGEGHIRWADKKRSPFLHLEIAQVNREPLDAFRDIFGKGNVCGPYGPYAANKKPYYVYGVYGQDAEDIGLAMLPYVFGKANQITEAIKERGEYVQK